MKKILSIAVILLFAIQLLGCAKCISTKYENVQVTVVDEYHAAMSVVPMPTGKVVAMVTKPAVYRITVEYNGVEYSINGKEIYEIYKDMVGKTVNATLEIKYYDDESVRYDIIELK